MTLTWSHTSGRRTPFLAEHDKTTAGDGTLSHATRSGGSGATPPGLTSPPSTLFLVRWGQRRARPRLQRPVAAESASRSRGPGRASMPGWNKLAPRAPAAAGQPPQSRRCLLPIIAAGCPSPRGRKRARLYAVAQRYCWGPFSGGESLLLFGRAGRHLRFPRAAQAPPSYLPSCSPVCRVSAAARSKASPTIASPSYPQLAALSDARNVQQPTLYLPINCAFAALRSSSLNPNGLPARDHRRYCIESWRLLQT